MKIIGKKVILRPIRLDDAPRFVKWLKDPEVNKFTSRKSFTMKEEIKWIKKLPKVKKTEKYFAIDTKEGVHIGSISLSLNKKDKNATFGIFIGDKNYWNKGCGTEATKLILDYGFSKLNLHRVYLYVYEYNPRAIKIYEKVGFKLEGARREDVFYGGKFYDRILMGILRKEWLKLK